MTDKKIDISKRKKPPGLDKTAWEELKYVADQVSNTLMFAPDTVESIYKGNAQPVVDRFRKMFKTKKEYFTPKKPTGKKITSAKQKNINQASSVIKNITEGNKPKVTFTPKQEKPLSSAAKNKQIKKQSKKYGGKIKNRNMGGVIGGGLASQDVTDYLYKYDS